MFSFIRPPRGRRNARGRPQVCRARAGGFLVPGMVSPLSSALVWRPFAACGSSDRSRRQCEYPPTLRALRFRALCCAECSSFQLLSVSRDQPNEFRVSRGLNAGSTAPCAMCPRPTTAYRTFVFGERVIIAPFMLCSAILHRLAHSGRIRTVRATEHSVSDFYSVPDDPARAMAALRGDCLDRALETVERMSLPVDMNFKALVVFIPANFARSHFRLLAFDGVLDTSGPPLPIDTQSAKLNQN